MKRFGHRLGKLCWWLQQVSGDAAYDNYLRHASASGTGSKILSRQEYYLDVLRRRYSGVSRCC